MKKLFLIFGFLITFCLTGAAVMANANYLHTITLEKNNTGYNILLGSDKMAKVNKVTPADNELVLELSGISSSDTVNALYKGTSNVESLVVENTAPGKLKIYITADNIKDSTVIMQPANGEAAIVGETIPLEKAVWIICVLALFAVIFKISKDVSEEDNKLVIKKDIKDREIELYRQYRNEMMSNPIMNSNKDLRMKKMLKKIDRKIDERLTSSIK